jgi:endo-1,4-beta-xylanase
MLKSGSSYVTSINTAGPHLQGQGDFAVQASISNRTGAGFLTLVGVLGRGQWWQELKRVDVGISGRTLTVTYWTGESSNSSFVSFAGDVSADPLPVEVARLGTQLVFSASGVELGRIDDPGLFSSAVFFGANAAPNSEFWITSLSAAAQVNDSNTIAIVDPSATPIQRSGNGLRDLADARGLLVGAALNPDLFAMPDYAATVGREFNLMVPENVMKFGTIHPAPDRYNFCPADRLIRFASANQMMVRGHTLVWHQQQPDWVTKSNWSRDDLLQVLHDHINTVVTRYKGKVFAWDVVNEALAYGPPYDWQTNSIWYTAIGPDYIDYAFKWAREADPDAKLFYNDTGGEGLGTKSDRVYALVKGLKDRGVPIDGLGLQMHLSLNNPISGKAVAVNLQRLADLGLDVHITEMDIQTPLPLTAERLAAQAAVYRDIWSACTAAPNCKALLTWGVNDGNSWILSFTPPSNPGLLFDEKYQPKSAYVAAGMVFGVQ